MKRSLSGALAAVGLIATVAIATVAIARSAEGPPRPVDFNRDVRPILAKKCFACHGNDDKHREAGLRLDLREAAFKKLDDGKTAIVPSHPEQSELVRRITAADPSERMPPADANTTLSRDEIGILTRWVAAGARYSLHWSFEKPQRSPLPRVGRADWPRNAVDFFILAKLEKSNLAPSPEADRYTLIRRLSLDLRGLPPSPAEVEQFVHDDDPAGYERLVDRMLADPAYGERWARPWLDLARYADSAGYASDPLRTIWLYRDWVIDALNADMPFDKFTVEQIAGDLLSRPTDSQLIATAFNRNTMTNTEGGTDDEEFRVAAVKDRVDTTLDVWMGLTIGCAKCHTHKFDPITQKEYYQCVAIFNQTADNDQPTESPTLMFSPPDLVRKRSAIDAKIASLKKQLPGTTDRKSLLNQIARLQKSGPKLVTVPVMRELPPQNRRKTHVMIKGNFLQPAEEVGPGIPAFFGSLPAGAAADRLALARWLIDRNNPLTGRVAANRIWARLFGEGIVETEEDFGTQGKLPTHPELLDWLAVEYLHRGWSTKAMIRLVVTSATYRQSSRITPEAIGKDPRNRLLGRAPRFRLEAEMVRDQAMALSGLLSQKMKGPSVFPPQPPRLWRVAFNGDRTWKTSPGAEHHRRGLYTFWRRTIPYPSMATFDAPSREICSIRRVRTNTPLQAFVTLNDPAYVEAAQGLARRIVREGGQTTAEKCRYALALCLGRPPQAGQIGEVARLLEVQRLHYRADAKAARLMATEPLGKLPQGMDDADLAAWTVVANVLLNLDGVLTKG